MKKVTIIVILWFLLTGITWFSHTTLAESNESLGQLDEIADEALALTKLGKYEEAKRLLEYFSNKFTTVTIQERLFSMDELRILTATHNQALSALTNMSLTPEERLNKVTTFRLVMDALVTQYQPLWTEMEDSIMTAFQQVEQAAQEGESLLYHQHLNSFLSKYSVIQPSLKVDIPVQTVQKLDAQIAFIDRYRTEVLTDRDSQNQLTNLRNDLQYLFNNTTEDEADPSLWWVIISTGSIIIVTLSYVGWRKYKGNEQKKKQEQND
jgi:sporulation protein YpjB